MSLAERTVLLVEDDPATAELERRALARAGIAVRLAATVGDALAALRAESFAAVLLDYALPDGDAWSVLEAAAAKRPRIPVIVVTGMGSEMVAAAASNRGAAAYVKKRDRYWELLPGEVDRVAGLALAEEKLRSTDALERVRARLAERELLLKEVHHRVKNNLQVVSSLLHLQAAHVQGAQAKQYFVESEARIRPIALAHEKLYHASDLASIELDEYLHDLVSAVAQTFGAQGWVIDASAPGIRLGIDTTVPVGMIVSELVSNSIKHAFPGGRAGRIAVSARVQTGGAIVLEVADDGIGLPRTIDPAAPTSMGLQIVRSLTAQLGGRIEVARGPEGTRYSITFEVRP